MKPLTIIIFLIGLIESANIFATPSAIHLCGTNSQSMADAQYVVFQPEALIAVDKANGHKSIIKPEPISYTESFAHAFVENDFPIPAICWEVDSSLLKASFPHLNHQVQKLRNKPENTGIPNLIVLKIPENKTNAGGVNRVKPAIIAAAVTFSVLSFVSPGSAFIGAAASLILCLVSPDSCQGTLNFLYNSLCGLFSSNSPKETHNNQKPPTTHYGGGGTWYQQGEGSDSGAGTSHLGGNVHGFSHNH